MTVVAQEAVIAKREQRKYTPQEKREAVELADEVGPAEAARRLSMPEGTLTCWRGVVLHAPHPTGSHGGPGQPFDAILATEGLADERLGIEQLPLLSWPHRGARPVARQPATEQSWVILRRR